MKFASPAKSAIASGKSTVAGAGRSTPSSRTSRTTPTISRHFPLVFSRMRLPSAADGSRHSSRARPSDTITTGRRS